MKTQVIVDKKTRRVICTAFATGRRHDFRLFKESKVHIHKDIEVQTDTGYQGITRIHATTLIPKKRTKEISSARMTNEHALGFLKRFRILSERLGIAEDALRFNLVAGICNFDLRL